MKSYSEDMSGADVVRKSGSTQPRPSGPDGRNPGQGTGRVDTVGLGPNTPEIVKTGATNNGYDNLPRRSGNR